jgi:hypothetical protein
MEVNKTKKTTETITSINNNNTQMWDLQSPQSQGANINNKNSWTPIKGKGHSQEELIVINEGEVGSTFKGYTGYTNSMIESNNHPNDIDTNSVYGQDQLDTYWD